MPAFPKEYEDGISGGGGMLGASPTKLAAAALGGTSAFKYAGASSPRAVVVNFDRRSVPLLRIALRRASARAVADIVMVVSVALLNADSTLSGQK
jgi:hypothetical protein